MEGEEGEKSVGAGREGKCWPPIVYPRWRTPPPQLFYGEWSTTVSRLG
jgi:hypothetical protein